jgi:hypothetical protein
MKENYFRVLSVFVCSIITTDSNSDPSVLQPVASRYTDYAIPAPNHEERKRKREKEEKQREKNTIETRISQWGSRIY